MTGTHDDRISQEYDPDDEATPAYEQDVDEDEIPPTAMIVLGIIVFIVAVFYIAFGGGHQHFH